mgnify:CR=1 FL=1
MDPVSYILSLLPARAAMPLLAAIGLCALMALTRGFVRTASPTVGNFWQDLVRATVLLLLPLSTMLALVLVWQGVPQSLAATAGAGGTGPIATQTAIALVGSNGGGYFNANVAHPLANPTPLSNVLAIVGMLVLPIAGCLAFGRMVGDRRQGRAILLANVLLFLPALAAIVAAETAPNPLLPEGVDQTATLEHDGGSLEGKEVRFGSGATALFAAQSRSMMPPLSSEPVTSTTPFESVRGVGTSTASPGSPTGHAFVRLTSRECTSSTPVSCPISAQPNRGRTRRSETGCELTATNVS